MNLMNNIKNEIKLEEVKSGLNEVVVKSAWHNESNVSISMGTKDGQIINYFINLPILNDEQKALDADESLTINDLNDFQLADLVTARKSFETLMEAAGEKAARIAQMGFDQIKEIEGKILTANLVTTRAGKLAPHFDAPFSI